MIKSINKELCFNVIPYINQKQFKRCMDELQSNQVAYFYRKLITFPQIGSYPDKKLEVKMVQDEFKLEIQNQLEQLFEVDSVYQIEVEFETLVREFIREIYIPSPDLMRRCLKLGKQLLDIRSEATEKEKNRMSTHKKSFEQKVKEGLKNSIYRQLSEEISYFDEKPSIKIFIELDGTIRK